MLLGVGLAAATTATGAADRVSLVTAAGEAIGQLTVSRAPGGSAFFFLDELALIMTLDVAVHAGAGRIEVSAAAGRAVFLVGSSRCRISSSQAGEDRLVRLGGAAGFVDGRAAVPADFARKVLPALLGRKVSGSAESHLLVVDLGKPEGDQGAADPAAVGAAVRQPTASPQLIVLDPGHGGAQFGFRFDGLLEKELALKLTQGIRVRLEQAGMHVQLTRSDDADLTATSRVGFGNAQRPVAFVSVHVGETLSGAIDARTQSDPPARLNGSLTPWLSASVAFHQQSRALARALVSSLLGEPESVLEVPLADLAGLTVPAALIEVPLELARSSPDETCRRLAEAITQAVASGGVERAIASEEVEAKP
ncbi:MAG: N-acetylmuramoyl-L-alanine amidase [Candidatus Schekmanbacteria bacterium]|nr:N-acetylmuramoyl-L-alanine amidase [Candidatus Schekmanbacteria bacterium]